MYHKIIHLPEHIIETYGNSDIFKPMEFNNLDLNNIKNVVICGMGGSAISGDIAASAFGKTIPIHVIKDYTPNYITKNTLVICCSYSGNTAETLSCLEQTLKVTPYISAVTSGGKMGEILDKKYFQVNLEPGMPPRSAIGFLFFSVIRILEEFQIIPKQTEVVKKLVASLVQKANAISNNKEFSHNIAKTASEKIKNKIPLIYGTDPDFAALAYRWKCQINENAKYPAFFHVFPEMNHNEIEGWESEYFKQNFIPIFLSKFSQKEKYQKRINAFKELMDNQGIEYLEFFAEGETLVEKIFSLIYLGDIISYYLAILMNVNPTTIKFIDFLKEKID